MNFTVEFFGGDKQGFLSHFAARVCIARLQGQKHEINLIVLYEKYVKYRLNKPLL